MSISFGVARLLRYVIASAAKFSETAVISVTEQDFTIKVMDPSKTALLILTVPREATLDYRVKGSEQLAVNLEDLSKVFRSSEKDDAITLSWTQSTLSASFERRGFSRTFTLPLSSATEEIPEIEIDYLNTYVLRPPAFFDALAGIEDVGDVIRIEGNENEFKLRAESELGEAEVTLNIERGGIESADIKNPGFSVSYSMEFLSNIRPVIRVAERLVARVDSDLPLYIEMSSHGLVIRYYVAPRAD